jgi:membrane protein
MNATGKKIKKTADKVRKSAIKYSKTHYFIGSGKISLFDFFNFFWSGLRNESISIRGSALAFKLFMSLFPAMIFFVTLLPYFSSAGFQEAFMQTLQSIMPEYSYKAFESTIRDILYTPRFGLASVVFVLSIFYSVTNMNSILSTFNKSHHLVDKRKYLKRILVSLWLTLSLFAIIFLSLTFISFNKSLVLWLREKDIFGSWFYLAAIQYGRWLILFFMMLAWLSILYTLGPPQKVKFRFFNPGSIFSSSFFIVISLGFNFFVNHFANYNKIYGVLGVILVFFIWLYYNSIVLLVGFEINASLFIAPNKKPDINKSKLE